MDNENEMQNQNQEAEQQPNEAYAGVSNDELKKLYNDILEQTKAIAGELHARHAEPEGAPAADFEALFESYRAPFRSRKENT